MKRDSDPKEFGAVSRPLKGFAHHLNATSHFWWLLTGGGLRTHDKNLGRGDGQKGFEE